MSTSAQASAVNSLQARPFGSLLIANRGEIALRVMRAASAPVSPQARSSASIDR